MFLICLESKQKNFFMTETKIGILLKQTKTSAVKAKDVLSLA